MQRQTQSRKRFVPGVAGSMRSRVGQWRRRAATLVAGGLALGMAYGVMFGHNGLTAYAKKREKEHTLKLQMQQLQKENGRLQGRVERLQKDPSAIEHQAREELHYTRAGEVIYTLPEPAGTPSHALPGN